MALAKCADCGRDVSTEAAACPNCGRPTEPRAGETQTAAQPAPRIWPPPPQQPAAASAPANPPPAPPMWPPPQPVAGAQAPKAKTKNWFGRHPILAAVFAVILIGIIAAAAAGRNNAQNASSRDNGSPPVASTPTQPPASHPRAPKPSLTGPQEQAVESAQNYLSEGMGFSRAGLIQQLSSKYGSGFPEADAVFAVDHLHVSWYQQAVAAAQNYKQTGMGFSCSGMVQQLTSSAGSGFTHAQAVYGATKAGVC